MKRTLALLMLMACSLDGVIPCTLPSGDACGLFKAELNSTGTSKPVSRWLQVLIQRTLVLEKEIICNNGFAY